MKKKKWYDSVINGIKVKMDGLGNYFDENGNIIDKKILFPKNSNFQQDSGEKKDGKVIPLFGVSTPWKPNEKFNINQGEQ
jgi:hypothetical protein